MNLIKIICIFVLVLGASSCAYMSDRGRDAAEMLTLSVEGRGFGVSAQAGPLLATGLNYVKGEGYGLRSGHIGSYEHEEANLLVIGAKKMTVDTKGLIRDKGYEMNSYFIPWFTADDGKFKPTTHQDVEVTEGRASNSLQVEAAVHVGYGLRAGINFAEVFDFFIGWFSFDPLEDDKVKVQKNEDAIEEEILQKINEYDETEKSQK